MKVVKVGDYVSFWSGKFIQTSSREALDNRAGCAALLEILESYPISFTTVFTVQEEIGMKAGNCTGLIPG